VGRRGTPPCRPASKSSGTAYAVWTGIGAVGTFALGILLFGEAATVVRFLLVGLIVVGILGLKFSTG